LWQVSVVFLFGAVLGILSLLTPHFRLTQNSPAALPAAPSTNPLVTPVLMAGFSLDFDPVLGSDGFFLLQPSPRSLPFGPPLQASPAFVYDSL